jgi:site-specific DNA-methyltransferase (adenine-specific)
MTIELLNCDCMDYMSGCADNSFDLAVVDVPYGIGESMNDNTSRGKGRGKLQSTALAYAKDYGRKDWDKQSPGIEYFIELFRVSKNQIIWGANHFISKISFDSPCWIVWDKVNYGNDFADCELAWTSFKTAVRMFRFQWNGLLQGDMKNKEKRIHPTQKPVALYRWIFQNYAKPGQRILDTHLGSGSSAIAAHYAGLDFVGCELDKEYYDAATKRFKQETRQMTLFGPEKEQRTKHHQSTLV